MRGNSPISGQWSSLTSPKVETRCRHPPPQLEFKRGLTEGNIRLRLVGEDGFGGGLAAAYDGEGLTQGDRHRK